MIECALALALVTDSSLSIDNDEFRMQQEGLANALSSEQIVSIIERFGQPVAIIHIHFAETSGIVLPWRLVSNERQLTELSYSIRNVVRPSLGTYTYMLDALRFTADQFNNVPCQTDRYVIDLSADGPDNRYSTPDGDRIIEELGEQFLQYNIRLNAIPIITDTIPHLVTNLIDYYESLATRLHGFVIPAHGFQDFEAAMRRKLILEIAGVY